MFVKWLKTKVIITGISFSVACLIFTSCSSNIEGEIIESATADNYDVSQLLLLSELPDRGISLYAKEPEGVILSIDDREYYYNWIYMTPRGIEPRMQVSDFDADGKDELSVILYMGSGTGVSISELHMIELSEEQMLAGQISDDPNPNQLQDHIFNAINYRSQLQKAITFITLNHASELSGELTIGTKVYPVNLQEFQSEECGKISNDLVWGNIVDFSSDHNKLTAEFGVGITCANFASPMFIGALYADVNYKDGEFLLENFRFEESLEK